VNSTILGLTTTDYLQRSVDGLWIPLTVAACVGLLLVWGHTTLRGQLAGGTRPGLFRPLVLGMAVIGLVLASSGLWSVVAPTVLRRHLVVAPLSLAFGVALVVYAAYLQRLVGVMSGKIQRTAAPQWVPMAVWAAVFVLVGLSLFWAANDYSAAVGRSRARQVVSELPAYPDAVLYSQRSLSLSAPGVSEARCPDPQAAYHFRYDGLKLVLQSGGQYLFLPERWSPANGVTIVLPRSDALRLEFRPAAAARTPARPGC
jgi:hypothetical protein